ncbi:hypothetical protein LTR66_016598 [Elasticomyces elasticus]|nr:hypothetical protein LTR66_016598 [Elasticomyces elasticus]
MSFSIRRTRGQAKALAQAAKLSDTEAVMQAAIFLATSECDEVSKSDKILAGAVRIVQWLNDLPFDIQQYEAGTRDDLTPQDNEQPASADLRLRDLKRNVDYHKRLLMKRRRLQSSTTARTEVGIILDAHGTKQR